MIAVLVVVAAICVLVILGIAARVAWLERRRRQTRRTVHRWPEADERTRSYRRRTRSHQQ